MRKAKMVRVGDSSVTIESIFRAIALANVLLGLPIGLYYRIRSEATREKLARREEGLFILVGLRLCGIAAWIVFAAYLINLASVSPFSLPLPRWLRWFGAALALLVPPLLWWTFRSLGKNLTDTVVTRRVHTLVTHGPYRWVRHPFYDVVLLEVIAISLVTANWLITLLGLAAVAMLLARTRIEEAKLVERFGADYQAYAERTGRFIPWPGLGTAARRPGK
jgi:protein-S-isoprenylcysteine O-methyltransferase Ste14